MNMKRSFVIFIIFLFGVITTQTAYADNPKSPANRLPGEVWIASITLMSRFGSPHDTIGKTVDERIERMLDRMEEVVPYQPDIICLSEVFTHTGLRGLPPVPERAEEVPGPIIKKFAAFAKKHHCYVICPIYTKRDGHVYNAAVLIDRDGKVAGEYDKIRPTEGEIKSGISPGPVDPPVFKTDFGIIGMQICFDANWPEGWRRLKEKGAKIIFWPSAFAGGRMLNALAYYTSCYIVSCTRYQPARIIDITGDELYATGRLQTWLCASVNLDKKIFHWDFQGGKFRDIQAKYGEKIELKIYHPEGWFTAESCSHDISMEKLIEEFDLVTYDEYIERATREQDKNRP